MTDSNKFEDAKKEIRSLLISYRDGCSLSEFLCGYRNLIGKKLPSKELGFRSDIDLLYAMPDAVYITSRDNGDYRLQGIADEKSLHIQKLVGKQKVVSKKRAPPRIMTQRIAPQRIALRRITPERIPPRFIKKELQRQPQYDRPSNSSSNITLSEEKHISLSSNIKETIIYLVKKFPNGIKIDEFLPSYEKHFGRSFLFQNYGYLSLIDCLENIPELEVEKNEHTAIIYDKSCYSKRNKVEEKAADTYSLQSQQNSFQVNPPPHNGEIERELLSNARLSTKTSSGVDALDNFEDNSVKDLDDRPGVPEIVKLNLHKLIQRYPQGIWAAEFPSCYEEVSKTPFDLHSLGYNYLADFIDDIPEILIRKSMPYSKKDWLIYPSDAFDIKGMAHNENISLPKGGALFIDYVILNIRKILEGYPEGIKLDEFLHVYSINCNDPLYVKDIGFDSVESFLSSVSERVPLKIESKNGCKNIYLLQYDDLPVKSPVAANEQRTGEWLPLDAASPSTAFTDQKLNDDFDLSKYIPVFTSSIAHPGLLYIQLQGPETSHALNTLYDDIEMFYKGPSSHHYLMKNVHIKVGASCVAFWPSDQNWYRAQIVSIPSMEFIEVFYVDYGTRDTIPKTMLRYIKKEYMKLPAQAIKSRLAFLKPPKNATKWDVTTKRKLLHMCQDVSLMAKIEEISSDGVPSLILCDTNGKEDLYINDILLKEGFAESIANEDYEDLSRANEVNPVGIPGLSALQAFQVQYYLQACATIAPSLRINEHFISLLKQLSVNCSSSVLSNSFLPQQMAGMVANPFLNAPSNPFLNPLVGNQNILMNPLLSPQGLLNPNLCQPSATKEQVDHSMSSAETISQKHAIKPSAKQQSPTPNLLDSKLPDDAENDFFQDDEDLFEKYFQELCTVTKRFVKRVNLGENYKIHVILVNSSPYASSGDISALIWNNKESDYLFRRLQIKEVDLATVIISETGNETTFQQLEKYNVKGIKKAPGSKSSILLYPLKSVIKILNIFGHPSVSVRTKLTEEIAEFSPSDPVWSEYSDSIVPENDEDNNSAGVTDDDKINRLCLYDLLAMKEGIRCRRLKMMNNLKDPEKNVDEIEKLEQLHLKVLDRIKEIKEICAVFS